jgi:two-component system, LytTR family, response regulator LytT
MRILIAEDEEHTRAELKYLLEKLEPTSTILETDDGIETINMVNQEQVDVLFLDVNMPGKDGLKVAAELLNNASPPLIVFATAYNQHAIKAFELAAVDYVVKPYRESRLSQTLERLRQTLSQREALDVKHQTMAKYIDAQKNIHKLWAMRDEDVAVLLDFKEILFFEADDKRVNAKTLSGDMWLVRYTMRELEERLVSNGFARTHKSYLVNLEHVREIEPWFSGSYLLRMNDDTRSKVPLSRQFAKYLKEITGWF